jgi:DNA polymerase-1
MDFAKANQLFSDLEFRTLGARLKEVLTGAKQESATASPQMTLGGTVEESVSPEELKETALALWLLSSSVTNPTLEDILNFARTSNFKQAKSTIFTELKKRNLEKVYEEIEKPLMPVIAKMESVGIKIDSRYLFELSKKYHVELAKLEKKIWESAGGEFNINSPKQLGEILFVKLGLKAKNQKKTGGGALSTRESELEKMKDMHPIIAHILEYRELAKLLSTYIDVIPTLVDKKGRLHATFLQTGTTTGRMSSNNPNLQNIPNKTELGRNIRKAFVAEEGFKLVTFDYSQIELRIAAFLSGDEKLIAIFKSGEDIHTAVASQVFNVSTKEVTKDMRRQAKVINFGVMYGMGVLALRQNLGTTREDAQKFYNEYFEKFSGLARYLDRIKAETARAGYTETFFGRRRYFEGIKSPIPYIRAGAERMAINSPIQGTEADIIKLAMIQVEEYLRENLLSEKARLLLQVHDELVYEIREKDVKMIAPEIKRIMENIIPLEKTSGVSCVADIAVGDTWGDTEKIS